MFMQRWFYMNLFVGCSSSENISKSYLEQAQECLDKVFKMDYDLVFGASNNGLMGISYRAAKKYNKEIKAIVPEVYCENLKQIDCPFEQVVNKINESTDVLFDNSDILLFLPGGIGSLNEIFYAIELKRNGKLNKPIIIYNINGFYDKLLSFLENLYNQNFIDLRVKEYYEVVETCSELIEKLKVQLYD